MVLLWELYQDYIKEHTFLAFLFWAFMVIGTVRILRQLYRICAVSAFYMCKKRNVDTYKKYGRQVLDDAPQEQRSWAIITGASDGIGLGFCNRLAERGFNIILLSRTKAKLEKVAAELAQKHGVKTFTVVRDLCKMPTLADFEKVVSEVPEEYDVAIVINNAGMGMPGPICENFGSKELQAEININALHPVYHMKAWTKRLDERKNRSGIINVSSTMGQVAMTGNAAYCSTKGFVSRITQSIWYEYKYGNVGIDVLDYRPAFVETNLSGRKASTFVVTTLNATTSALDDLGQTRWTNGPFAHHILEWGGDVANFFIPSIYHPITYQASMKVRTRRRG